MKILVLNGGSSSFKCWFERSFPMAHARWGRAPHVETCERPELTQPASLETALEGESPPEIDVVGHRIVHGGPKYRESGCSRRRFAPPSRSRPNSRPPTTGLQLDGDRDRGSRLSAPDVPQVAVFDTGFHATLEPAAYVYPGPYAWLEARHPPLRISRHQRSILHAARRRAVWTGSRNSSRLIVCHLGNGASLTAVRDGKSVDTTMGFTPLEGLMMGTRSGSIDPGILVYLIRHHGYSADQMDQILNRESGLLGVSGISGDMREILEAIGKGNAPGATGVSTSTRIV